MRALESIVRSMVGLTILTKPGIEPTEANNEANYYGPCLRTESALESPGAEEVECL